MPEVGTTAAALERFIDEHYHRALDQILKGSPDGCKEAYSRGDDVTLANRFGPPARGWEQVARTLERAALNFRDGQAMSFERVATCVTPELAYIVEMEHGRARVGGRADVTPVPVRVTTIFRPEDGAWRVV